jgi:hypothetical protein
MRHLKTFESSDNLWREIDISQEELGPIRPALDSFTKGEITSISSVFQPLVGSFSNVQVNCRNFRRPPINIFRIGHESSAVRDVSTHNLSRGTVEVTRPRTPPHSVRVDIDWSTHSISIFKSVDDHFLVHRVGPKGTRDGWYLCDGLYGLIQLLKIFCQEFSEVKGPFAVRRGEIFRNTYNMFMVLADVMEPVNWVPVLDIAHITRNGPRPMLSKTVVRRLLYRPASQEELRTLMDQVLSEKSDRYLRNIEETFGLDLLDVLTRALTPTD